MSTVIPTVQAFTAPTIPNVYRLVGPAVIADASGGTATVNANTKFNTNIPVGSAMLANRILYFLTWTKQPQSDTAATTLSSWTVFVQLTEALSRTIPVTTDALFVDEWTVVKQPGLNLSAVGAARAQVSEPGLLDRFLANPWLTSAQQLNLIVAVQPNNVSVNGPNVSVAPVIEYTLVALTTQLQAYLATRIQLLGQA